MNRTIIAVAALAALCAGPTAAKEQPRGQRVAQTEDKGAQPGQMHGKGSQSSQELLDSTGLKNYKLLFENEKVRVSEFNARPNETIPMHSHPEHFVYGLNDCRIDLQTAAGRSEKAEIGKGKVVYMEATEHTGRVAGAKPCKLLIVELKESAGPASPTGPEQQPGGAAPPGGVQPRR